MGRRGRRGELRRGLRSGRGVQQLSRRPLGFWRADQLY